VSHTLLLADDSVTIQRVIELTFADEDVQVIAVSDGDQAIERLNSGAPPDIVLADIGMPGKNGYEVAQYIRQTPRLAHIPVMLLTGAFEPVDQARAAEAGCDGVLAKPFEPQLVIGRVKELLARAPRPATTGTDHAPVPAAPHAAPIGDHIFSAPGIAQQEPLAPGALNDYFDRLDAAFANVTPGLPAPPPARSATPGATPSAIAAPPSPAAPLGASEIDWFGTAGGAVPAAEGWDLPAADLAPELPDLPLSYTSLEQSAAPALAEPFMPTTVPAVAPAAPVFDAAPSAPFVPVAVAAVAPAAPVFDPAPYQPLAPIEAVAPEEPVRDEVVPSTPFVPIVAVPVTSPEPVVAATPSRPSALEPAASPAHVAAFTPAAYVTANPPPASVAHGVAAPAPGIAPHSDLPPLADAFAALLAAEQSEPLATSAPAWPGLVQAPPAASDEIVEAVTRRVLDRLADSTMRETIADIVTKIADQLIREEIEKIKASIK